MKNIIITGEISSGINTFAAKLKYQWNIYNIYTKDAFGNFPKQIQEPCIIAVHSVNDIPVNIVNSLKSSMVVYLDSNNSQDFHFNNVKKLLEKETFNKINKKDCSCSSFDLLHFGCSCGYQNG